MSPENASSDMMTPRYGYCILPNSQNDSCTPVDLKGMTRAGLVKKQTDIPDICHGRHGRRPCKFFLAGVNLYRFNAKNWHF